MGQITSLFVHKVVRQADASLDRHALVKEFHLDPKEERQIRKSFGKLDQQPKILIVTEKRLTGFDAPVLYAMYGPGWRSSDRLTSGSALLAA